MTTSRCYVWRWLLGAADSVVAGELRFDSIGRWITEGAGQSEDRKGDKDGWDEWDFRVEMRSLTHIGPIHFLSPIAGPPGGRFLPANPPR
jgi:hypothetical protein